jgi:hypothetical protein
MSFLQPGVGNNFIKYVGTPVAVVSCGQNARQHNQTNKHQQTIRRKATEKAMDHGYLSYDDYTHIQIAQKGVSVDETQKALTCFYSAALKSVQKENSKFNFKHNGTKLIYRQNWDGSFFGTGTIEIGPKTESPRGGQQSFASIQNASQNKLEGRELFQSNFFVPNNVYTVGVAPHQPGVERIANVSRFGDSPMAIILTYATVGVAFLVGIPILNKWQTGSFFPKAASEMVSYKEGALFLKQATFLLTKNFGMSFDEAAQFLKDDLSPFPNQKSTKQ